ncbi:hypothetical protein, partial [Planktothrix sp. FACHB-1355]|uniref:hypothetical protein n=1 Tax=Planktothrix sp. FACHB-1355 TaxID=2692854 RepID=UPI001A7E8256
MAFYIELNLISFERSHTESHPKFPQKLPCSGDLFTRWGINSPANSPTSPAGESIPQLIAQVHLSGLKNLYSVHFNG